MLDQHVVAAVHNLACGSNIHTMRLHKVTKFLGETFWDDGDDSRITLQAS